jgi:hypothetical protein
MHTINKGHITTSAYSYQGISEQQYVNMAQIWLSRAMQHLYGNHPIQALTTQAYI